MVPFLELKTQYLGIKDEIADAIQRVLDSTQYALGAEVEAFEEEFAAFSGSTYGVGMNSGTSALHLALLAAGAGPGDEVITVPHTFVATVAAVLYAGATPVFVDIDPASYTMDPDLLEAAITKRTKVVMPVHLYGQAADMDPILDVARRHRLTVIEDAAQAHGAEYKERKCGSMGDMACFSFYPGKNLGAYGEAGMVLTDREDYKTTLRMLRDWGQKTKYAHVLKGFNARMDGIQGAVLRVKLRHLEAWTESRRERARQYGELLAGCEPIGLPVEYSDRRHAYHLYVVRVADREGFMGFLGDRDVGAGIHYPTPVHLLEGYADLGYKEGEFPEAERAAAEVVSLPMYPELTSDHVVTVAGAIEEWAAR